MAKKTTGKLYISGKKKYYYIRFKYEGKETRTRLLDLDGKPILKLREAQAAADRLLSHINETNKAEQLRTLKNDIRDAEEAAEEAEARLVNSKSTIAAGFELFMTCPKRPTSCKRYPVDEIPRHTTAANYQSYYKHFVEWTKHHAKTARLLSDITPDIAAHFMNAIRKENAPGTFNKYLQFFNCFFDVLNRAGKVNIGNPFQDIDRAEPEYNSKKPLSVEQVARLIDQATGDLKLIFALGYFTGLRMGDCCTLKWQEIDLLRGVIERIPRKTAHTIKDKAQATVKIGIAPYLFGMLKAIPAAERTGYLLPEFAKTYLAGGTQKITKIILKHFTDCGIETHRQGTGITTITNEKTGKQVKTGSRAVVEIGFHSLRYSYISHNAEAGTPAAIIQKNAGHANPAMTEHYTKISDKAAVQYAAALTLPTEDAVEAETIDITPERRELQSMIDGLTEEQVKLTLAYLKENFK